MLPRSEGLEDFSGVQDAVRVESFLDRLHGFPLGVVEHEAYEFGLGQPNSVLAAYGAAQLYHQGEVIGMGKLQCTECNHTLQFNETAVIPACPQCGATTFRRVEAE